MTCKEKVDEMSFKNFLKGGEGISKLVELGNKYGTELGEHRSSPFPGSNFVTSAIAGVYRIGITGLYLELSYGDMPMDTTGRQVIGVTLGKYKDILHDLGKCCLSFEEAEEVIKAGIETFNNIGKGGEQ